MRYRWPPHLQTALDRALVYAPGHSVGTIEDAITNGLVQCWDTPESFCLTELKRSPNGRTTCHLFLAGGNLGELQPLYPVIEDWARSQGAVEVTLLGRDGWTRSFLTRMEGFRPTMTFYVKELT